MSYRIIYIFVFLVSWLELNGDNLHYYCTAADQNHVPHLMNLIGSIHKNDYTNLGEILVFDLGIPERVKMHLKYMRGVRVMEVELVHPDLLKYFQTCPSGRKVRGYFAWKPVIIKQALEIHPYTLYLDSGITILKSMDSIFDSIIRKGYFLIDAGCDQVSGKVHNICDRVTLPVVRNIIEKNFIKFKEMLLHEDTYMISGGVQGISRSLWDSYVFPCYLTAKDLSLYEDDKSAQLGWGAARHDQCIFSIFAQVLGLELYPEGAFKLDNGSYVNQHWDKNKITNESTFYVSRGDYNFLGGFKKYIKISRG